MHKMDQLRLLLRHMVQSQTNWIEKKPVFSVQFNCDKELIARLTESEIGMAVLSERVEPPADSAPAPPGEQVFVPPAPLFQIKKEYTRSELILGTPVKVEESADAPKSVKKNILIQKTNQLSDELLSALKLGISKRKAPPSKSGGNPDESGGKPNEPSGEPNESGAKTNESGGKPNESGGEPDESDESDGKYDDDLFNVDYPTYNHTNFETQAPKRSDRAQTKEPPKMDEILIDRVKSQRSGPAANAREKIQMVKDTFERFDDFDYARRVRFANEIYGVDNNKQMIGPFLQGGYLQTDDKSGLSYFSVDANGQKYVIAANVNYITIDEMDGYVFDKQAHSAFLVEYEPINGDMIRATALSMFNAFMEKADVNQPYEVIHTSKKMDFYKQSREKVQHQNFAFLGYDAKQEIYYYATWKGKNTLGDLDYAVTMKEISGEIRQSAKLIKVYKEPYAIYYDSILINIVSPQKKRQMHGSAFSSAAN